MSFDPDDYVREQEQLNREKANGAADGGHVRELETVWADDIELDLDKPGLVDGLLPAVGLSVIYGPSGAGKTFVILDMACHIAAKHLWRGFDVQQGIVIYVAAEAPASVQRRVWAWKRRHRVDHLPVLVVRSSVDLLSGDTDAILALLAKIQAEHGPIALVVVDTLGRAMLGNENSPEDMGEFVAACGRIKDACATHVAIVHHSGKDEARGARGHSSLRAATDVEIEITKTDDRGCIRVSKNRDGEEGLTFGFRLEQVELGGNARGRMVTTCVALDADAPAGQGKKRPLRANAQLVFDALTAIVAERADPPPPAADIPRDAKGAVVERWQEAALRYLPQPEEKRKREAFNRALSSLVASQVVRHAAGFAWLP